MHLRFFTYYNAIFLLQGMWRTFLLSAIGCSAGLIAGFVLAVLRDPAMPGAIRVCAAAYVEIARRVPFLVTLFLVFYTAQLAGWDLSQLSVGIIAVSCIATAYLSEILRAGFESVHQNQRDSAAVANFGFLRTMILVLIPQSWRVALPPAFAFFLMFIKDSALASQIGVVELTYVGKTLNNRGFSPALSFGAILVLYFALSYPLARLGRKMEARLGRDSDQRA